MADDYYQPVTTCIIAQSDGFVLVLDKPMNSESELYRHSIWDEEEREFVGRYIDAKAAYEMLAHCIAFRKAGGWGE